MLCTEETRVWRGIQVRIIWLVNLISNFLNLDGSLNTWISLHHTAFDTEMSES